VKPQLQIISETDRYLLINKPTLSHSTTGGKKTSEENRANSIAYALSCEFPQYIYSSPNPADCGLVNRLDYETSGLLVVAKTEGGWQELHELFTSARVKKSYLCVVEGELQEERTIEGYIFSSNKGSKKVKVSSRERDGVYSKTTYRPICFLNELNATVVEAKTGTGRRHQVRAHAAFAGHPLLGDTLYGASRHLPLDGIPPFILHGRSISASLSFEGEVHWSAPPPKYYFDLLDRYSLK